MTETKTEALPLDPLTAPGWYELDDRTWQEFRQQGSRLVGGRRAETWDEVAERMREDLEDPDRVSALLRSRTYDCHIEMCDPFPTGPTYRIHYRDETTGEMIDLTGPWSRSREMAIARLRRLVADGYVRRRA